MDNVAYTQKLNELTEKQRAVIELFDVFVSLSAEEKNDVLDFVKKERPNMYPFMKELAEMAKEHGYEKLELQNTVTKK